MMMNITFFTNRGGVREHNEDAMFLAGNIISCCSMAAPVTAETESADKCFVVIDGMGGYHGGEKAANIVASSFASDADGWNIPVKATQEKIMHILETASREISEAVKINPQYSSMGAALAGIVFCSDGILAFNCGDCRVYVQNGEYLEKLTHDHSFVQELCDRGEITDDEMRTHPRKNVITACVSQNADDIHVFFRTVPLSQKPRRFLVCSDGVWEALPLEALEKYSAKDSMYEAGSFLTSCLLNLQSECRDNVSFLFAG